MKTKRKSAKNQDKSSKSVCSKVWRAERRYWGELLAFSAKKSKLLLQMWIEHCACQKCSNHDVDATVKNVQITPFLMSTFFYFFDRLSCFASVGWKVLKCRLGQAWIGPVKSHWTMNISANSFRIKKSFGWLSKNLLRFLFNFPCLIATEQYAYCSRGKINFWSHHLSEDGPKNFKFFIGFLFAVASNRSKEQAEKSCIRNMPREFSWNTYLISNLYFVTIFVHY